MVLTIRFLFVICVPSLLKLLPFFKVTIKGELTLLPNLQGVKCMSGYEIPEEACKQAGLSFGGTLYNGKDMMVVSKPDRNPGCYIKSDNTKWIVFNRNNNGINNMNLSAPICKSMSVSS